MSEISTQPQEVTHQPSSDVGVTLPGVAESHTPATYMIVIQLFIGFFSVFGNLLIIRVLYDLPNSKLRKTTKLLMYYVSISYCVLSTLVMMRLFNLPCTVFLIGSYMSGFNVLSGILLLAYEALMMVARPYDHRKFISINICRIGICLSFLVSGGINVAAYMTWRESYDQYCYFNNGIFVPTFLAAIFGLVVMMILVTTTLQVCTLRELKKSFSLTTMVRSDIVSSNQIAPIPVISQPGPQDQNIFQSPLYKLIKMLRVSALCFVFCWCPSIFLILTLAICEGLEIQIDYDLKRRIATGFSSLIVLNGSLRVIIYLVMSTQVRLAVKDYLKRRLCFLFENHLVSVSPSVIV